MLNVKLGFDGYNGMKTKKYPKGQPNVLLARSIESGSSIAKKRPFVAPAVRKTKKAAEETMAKITMKKVQNYEMKGQKQAWQQSDFPNPITRSIPTPARQCPTPTAA